MTVRCDAVGADRLADDVRRAAVAIAPEVVAEQDHRLGAGPIVARRGSRGRGSAGRPAPRTPPTVSWPPLNRSGRPSSVDRFIGAKPYAPICSNEVCRSCQDGEVLDADRLPRLVLRRVGRRRPPRCGRRPGSGRPLNRPPLTTQKTVVLRPMPRPSVRIATIESVGYLTSIRMPERTSLAKWCMTTEDEWDGRWVQGVRSRFSDPGPRDQKIEI